VPVEAEIKAKVRYPDQLRATLDERATGEPSTYHDRYFDLSDHRLTRGDRELRVRTVTDAAGKRTVLLTYKEPVVDAATGSKPEHETTAADAEVLVTALTALGAVQVIAFRKACVNYRFTAHGRELLATLVTIPELGEEMFIELETQAGPSEVDAALAVVRDVLGELGIEPDDYTTELYTDAVIAHRG
jgi:adenylate cyclase class 2